MFFFDAVRLYKNADFTIKTIAEELSLKNENKTSNQV